MKTKADIYVFTARKFEDAGYFTEAVHCYERALMHGGGIYTSNASICERIAICRKIDQGVTVP